MYNRFFESRPPSTQPTALHPVPTAASPSSSAIYCHCPLAHHLLHLAFTPLPPSVTRSSSKSRTILVSLITADTIWDLHTQTLYLSAESIDHTVKPFGQQVRRREESYMWWQRTRFPPPPPPIVLVRSIDLWDRHRYQGKHTYSFQ
jgi:hypothetical protein